MTISKEQWIEIEKQLSSMFGRVHLKADGYDVKLVVEPYKALRSAVVVYVNGWWKAEWMKGGCPEAEKFMQECRRWMWSAARREVAKQKLKNKRLDTFLRDWYQEVAEQYTSVWSPAWTSPKSLCRHLRKSCADIELVEIGYRV
jgi:hypothetical protein